MITYHINDAKKAIAAVLRAEEFNNKIFVGVSHCSYKDTFDEKVGCEIARIRAIKKLEQYKMQLIKKRIEQCQNEIKDLKMELLHKEGRVAELDIDQMSILATLE